jgi:2,4-dienoyl-CoA reductase-like NADH-dependent reductase (Old Yellow Enzyme family)
MTRDEVKQSIDSFIDAARRCDRAGFDGVELHGAHGYLICEFLSPEINRRPDEYGGSLDNRSRFLFEVVDGVRAVCRSDFSLGVRLSPERFGMQVLEVRTVAQRLMTEGKIDYLDMPLWDCSKEPEAPALKGRSLMSYFTDLHRGSVRLGAAGKIMSGSEAAVCSAPTWTLWRLVGLRHPASRLPQSSRREPRVPLDRHAGHSELLT